MARKDNWNRFPLFRLFFFRPSRAQDGNPCFGAFTVLSADLFL